MISGVTREIDGQSETFRLTTRAMMALEDHYDQSIVDLLQGLEDGFRLSTIVRLLAECGDDGKGIDFERAQGAIDALGVTAAGDLLGEVAQAAFPEAEKGKASGNGKRAPSRK